MKSRNKQKIQKTYKFRLYPTREQEEKLFWTLEKCRFVYNIMLDGLQKQVKPDRYSLQKSLLMLKEEYPDLKNIYSKALQCEVYRLFCNLKALDGLKKKGKRVGKLRFKGKSSYKTIHYNQSGFKVIPTKKRLYRLHISKIGDIPIRMHRSIDGKIKQVVIKNYQSGKWYALIVVETNNVNINQSIKNVIGIDVGIKYFLSDSDGRQIENPLYLKKNLQRLERRQRKLSKSKKGSKNRNKQRIRVAQLYERITNQREDYLHKLSSYYIKNYDLIAVENLSIGNLIKNHHLAQLISDVSWNKFSQMLSYKAESASKILVRVDPRNTSKIHKYGKATDRDYNASLNILEKGLQIMVVGMGQTEFTPVDIRPLQKLNVISASSVVESGNLSKHY